MLHQLFLFELYHNSPRTTQDPWPHPPAVSTTFSEPYRADGLESLDGDRRVGPRSSLALAPESITEVCSFHDETGDFPEDTISRIHSIIAKPNEDDDERDSLLHSLAELSEVPDEPDSRSFLLNQIFYPTVSISATSGSENVSADDCEFDQPIFT
jgi:hypothetical protein